jgi:hypothetical protein
MYDPDRGWMSAEDLLVEALDTLLESVGRTHAEVVELCRLALDDGTTEVMRDCLSTIVARLEDTETIDEAGGSQPCAILPSTRLTRLWAGKT